MGFAYDVVIRIEESELEPFNEDDVKERLIEEVESRLEQSYDIPGHLYIEIDDLDLHYETARVTVGFEWSLESVLEALRPSDFDLIQKIRALLDRQNSTPGVALAQLFRATRNYDVEQDGTEIVATVSDELL